LNHDAATFFLDSQLGQRFIAANHHAAAGGFFPSARSAELDRLAGDHRSGGLAKVHGISVHDPSHGLFVGATSAPEHPFLDPASSKVPQCSGG